MNSLPAGLANFSKYVFTHDQGLVLKLRQSLLNAAFQFLQTIKTAFYFLLNPLILTVWGLTESDGRICSFKNTCSIFLREFTKKLDGLHKDFRTPSPVILAVLNVNQAQMTKNTRFCTLLCPVLSPWLNIFSTSLYIVPFPQHCSRRIFLQNFRRHILHET